ncbi:16 kDa calcium-binding protein isoform 1 [Schistosoma japonicum]|uniref:16 kDa calcium-binding protein isoform 1 n=1 Tax=Schistosoma japonicum TaxID=6182 RepID=Q5DDP6_SCHJA|nr:SJCHGC05185 protein [Schistosoma japonicum]KAH8867074.1 Calcium-dependent protein kinase SK5 [Schistosoma japonicum]TNN18910.1 16 kDa calcium-binding protein isoform 1 [Schistosoma japonicum]
MDKRALIEKFHQMDKNCDGVLTANEIRICVQRSGLPESKVNEFLRLFDLSGDNVITLQEYICALGLQPPPPKDINQWRMAFNSIDKDRSGYLTPDEIQKLLHECGYNRCTQIEIDNWIKTVDKNDDGQISFDEFTAFLSSKTDDYTNHS